MISYELAKKLKDAGFPQNHKSVDCLPCVCGVLPQRFHFDIHIPTLSELISACGDKFIDLFRTDEGEWICAGRFAIGRMQTDKALSGVFEKTPEEAVANLWLEIHKCHNKDGLCEEDNCRCESHLKS